MNELRLQRLEEAHKTQKEVEEQIVEFMKFLDESKKDSNTADNETLPSYRKQIQQLAFDVKSVYDKVSQYRAVHLSAILLIFRLLFPFLTLALSINAHTVLH